ncbi:MAG TPA: hypothetical protein VD704_05420 [Gaiellaceae bacterium]|nr:hypothetical protein [Gaiellaceae bacterium]
MRALVAFAAAVAVFHHVPSVGGTLGDVVDLVTPFAVVGAAAVVLLELGAWGAALGLAVAAGIAYVDGHGLHLAANSIRAEGLTGEAEDVAYFWDERFSHVEWHLGLIGLVLAFCLAEPWARPPLRATSLQSALVVALLGATLFTSTVEGQTWWLLPPTTALFALWALARPRPVLGACAGAFVLASLLLAGWAAWHRGVPEFSDLGWI